MSSSIVVRYGQPDPWLRPWHEHYQPPTESRLWLAGDEDGECSVALDCICGAQPWQTTPLDGDGTATVHCTSCARAYVLRVQVALAEPALPRPAVGEGGAAG